jgi:hypothetical protein
MNFGLILVACLLGQAQDNNNPPKKAEGAKTMTWRNEFVEFRLRYDNTLRYSKPTPILLTVENIGKNLVIYDDASLYSGFEIEIRDRTGNVVPETRFGQSRPRGGVLRREMALYPGQKIEIEVPVQRCFDLSEPGQYTLTVRNRRGFLAETGPQSVFACDIRLVGVTFLVKD